MSLGRFPIQASPYADDQPAVRNVECLHRVLIQASSVVDGYTRTTIPASGRVPSRQYFVHEPAPRRSVVRTSLSSCLLRALL